MRVTDGIIAAPGQEKVKNRIGDELLLGIAATGSPECGRSTSSTSRSMDRGDETLPTRAMSALYKAYVDPAGLFDIVEPGGARAQPRPRSSSIAKDDAMPPARRPTTRSR